MGIHRYSGKKELKFRLVGLLGKLFIDALFSTFKIEFVGYEKSEPIFSSRRFIAAIWHSRILAFSYLYKGMNAAILVSGSDDGELIARVLDRQGHEPIRGSTRKRGGIALVKMVNSLKDEERPAVVIPDGPQGPRFKVQPGVVLLAKLTGYPILPLTYSARKIKVFCSWDRFILPYPFTKCRIVYGDPIRVPRDAGADVVRKCLDDLQQGLRSITFEADRYFGHHID